MRIAMGIVGVLLVLAIIYYFLPQGIKTTISAVFTGSRTSQTAQQSPAPSVTTAPVAVNATPGTTAQPTTAPSPTTVANNRTSPSPSATARGAVAGSTTATGAATASPRAVANAGSNGLPGTGFENQPVELSIIQVLACTLLVMVGFKLRKHI